jgi:N-acetylmuramoyl-L-alanine amidase
MHSLVINKKWLFGFLVAILAGLLLLVPFGTEAKAATTGTGKVVVIDPGHQYVSGIFGDTGALSPDFVSTSQTPDDTEAYLNVQVAYKLCHELQDRGYTVYSTSYIASDVPNLIAKSKGVSYTLRDRINASATVSPNLYISVHHNVTGVGTWTSACGAEVLYDNTDSTLKSRSCTLANLVYNSMATLGSSVTGNRYTHVKNQAATVLTYNTAPAVTVEVGFMDNAVDLARIQNESSQQVTVEKIADGVDSYITQYPGNPYDNTPPTAGSVYTSAGDGATTSTSINLEVADVQDDSGVQSVKFLVYNYEDGHTSDKWIEGTGLGNNKWGAIMNLSDWGYESGTYIVDVFATDTMGNFGYVGGTQVQFERDTTPPTATKAYTSAGSTTTRSSAVNLEVAGVTDASGISNVKFLVYNLSQGHASDQWISGVGLGSNKWGAMAVMSSWGYTTGTYIVDVFATDEMGNFGYVATTQFKYFHDSTPPTATKAYTSAGSATTKSSSVTLEVAGVTDDYSGVSNVKFLVYNYSQGHASDQWISGVSLGSNKWGAIANTSNWGYASGTYIVDVFATDGNGNFGYVATTQFKYQADTNPPTATKAYTSAGSGTTQSSAVNLEVAGVVDDYSGVSNVKFLVYNYTNGGHATDQWISGVSLGSSKWGAIANMSNWGYASGTYIVDVFATDGKGNFGYVATTQFIYEKDTSAPTATKAYTSAGSTTTERTTVNLEVAGVTDPSGVSNVKFLVYNYTNGGHATDQWISGVSLGSNKWGALASMSNWGYTSGTYIVDVFGTDGAGNFGYIATTQFKYEYVPDTTPPTATKAYTSAGSSGTSSKTISLEVAGVTDESGVANVKFLVYYYTSGHSTDKWISGVSLGDNKWGAQMNVSDWGSLTGTYIIDVFATDTQGNFGYIATTQAIYTGYSIMGGANATRQQMINYYIANARLRTTLTYCGPVDSVTYFPTYYGITLGQFVDAYIYEANQEGVRPEVAFAQMCHETGFLRFGGQVSIGQLNFAGIGATDGGAAGASFSDILTGIRAQIQHLKAYASTEALNNTCVDPRFSLVTRGCAPRVEDLGNGYWASSSDYGASLLSKIYSILSTSTANIYGATDTSAPTATKAYTSAGSATTTSSNVNLEVSGVTDPSGVSSVQFLVYNYTNGGHTTDQWISGVSLGSNKWGALATMSDWDYSAGTYIVDVFGTDSMGNFGYIATTQFKYAPSSSLSILAEDSLENTAGGSVSEGPDSEASEEVSEEPDNEASEEVSEEPDSEASEEVSEEPDSEASEEVSEGPDSEASEEVSEEPDSEAPTESTEPSEEPTESMESVSEADTVQEYVIMSSSAVTTEQLKNIFAQYQSANPMPSGTEGYDELGFPTYYGMAFEQFANQYVQEAVAEGVNPEIAFAQAMVETDYLRFTGSAGINQYNFGGFVTDGTTDSFSDLTTGIRAQIQHLKCLASADPCVNAIVDLHWDDSVRGTAAALQDLLTDLGKDESYSNKIWSILNQLN